MSTRDLTRNYQFFNNAEGRAAVTAESVSPDSNGAVVLRCRGVRACNVRDLTSALQHAWCTANPITTLDLHGNRVGDEGAAILAKALTRYNDSGSNHTTSTGGARTHWGSALHTLCLSDNEIGDAGVRALAHALRPRRKRHPEVVLTALNLTQNEVSNAGAAALLEALTEAGGAGHMKVLYMTGNAIDTDMLHQLDVAINPRPAEESWRGIFDTGIDTRDADADGTERSPRRHADGGKRALNRKRKHKRDSGRRDNGSGGGAGFSKGDAGDRHGSDVGESPRGDTPGSSSPLQARAGTNLGASGHRAAECVAGTDACAYVVRTLLERVGAGDTLLTRLDLSCGRLPEERRRAEQAAQAALSQAQARAKSSASDSDADQAPAAFRMRSPLARPLLDCELQLLHDALLDNTSVTELQLGGNLLGEGQRLTALLHAVGLEGGGRGITSIDLSRNHLAPEHVRQLISGLIEPDTALTNTSGRSLAGSNVRAITLTGNDFLPVECVADAQEAMHAARALSGVALLSDLLDDAGSAGDSGEIHGDGAPGRGIAPAPAPPAPAQRWPPLRVLNLANCALGPSDAKVVARALSGSEAGIGPGGTIEVLLMGFNELRDRGACHMAECLRTNRSLLTVRLNNCAITDSGVRRLSRAISEAEPESVDSAGDPTANGGTCESLFVDHAGASRLTELDLSDNRGIGVAGITELRRMLHRNASVRKIELCCRQAQDVREDGADHATLDPARKNDNASALGRQSALVELNRVLQLPVAERTGDLARAEAQRERIAKAHADRVAAAFKARLAELQQLDDALFAGRVRNPVVERREAAERAEEQERERIVRRELQARARRGRLARVSATHQNNRAILSGYAASLRRRKGK